MITYSTEDSIMPKFPRRRVSSWIKNVAQQFNKRVGDINFIFCSENKILELNNAYLKHDYFTDIITFDYSDQNCIAGDLFISIETVRSNAEIFNEPFIKELYRVMIHGILHLCGIKDKEETERITMKKYENEALELFDKSCQ